MREGQGRHVEFEVAGLGGEERVVPAGEDVLSRMELQAALADDDLPGEDVLVYGEIKL